MKYLTPFNDFEMVTENKKYDHINFIPPLTVANKAKKGIKHRKKYKSTKGEVAVKIAKKLLNRDKMQPYKVKQMCTFFSRHKNRNLLAKYKDEPWKDRKHSLHLCEISCVPWLL